MPQAPTNIKVKSRTSQITAIIAAIVAIIGIGALIYFAVVGSQQKVVQESQLPLLEPGYNADLEEKEPNKNTNPEQVADYNEKIANIASDVAPIVDKTAQEQGKTSQQVLQDSKEKLLIDQAAQQITVSAKNNIESKTEQLADEDKIKNANTEIAETLINKEVLDNLNYQYAGSAISLQDEISSSENQAISQTAETVADEINQSINQSSQEIAVSTNGNQNEINDSLSQFVYYNLNLTTQYEINSLNYEITIAEVEIAADDQIISKSSDQLTGISYYACTKAKECIPQDSQEDCVNSFGQNNCFTSLVACQATDSPCAKTTGDLIEETVTVAVCENNQCQEKDFPKVEETNPLRACIEDPNYGAEKCFETMALCVDSGCGQFTFYYCQNNEWLSGNFPYRPDVLSPQEYARTQCQNENNVQRCYLESDADYENAHNACSTESVNEANEPVNEEPATKAIFICNQETYQCDKTSVAIDYDCREDNGCYATSLSCDKNCQPAEPVNVNQEPTTKTVFTCNKDTYQCQKQTVASDYTCDEANDCYASDASCQESCQPVDFNEKFNTWIICENQACVKKQVPSDAEPCASTYSPEVCFADLESCEKSDCQPKQEYYYCEPNVGCQTGLFAAGECEAQYSNCYSVKAEGSDAKCDLVCNASKQENYYYCDYDKNTCNQVDASECLENGGDKFCTISTNCCLATFEPLEKSFNYCDLNDKTNSCKQTESFIGSSDEEILNLCEAKYGIGNCLSGKKTVCDLNCQPDPVLDPTEKGCKEYLPNDPNCPLDVIKKIENPEQPITEFIEPNLAIEKKIYYRGLGRVIIKFWADPSQETNFNYTRQKLADDFKNNKLKVRLSDNKNNLTDILKVYKDPHNPNKYYAIAYKLNLDNLWQKDDSIYKTKKYYFKIYSDNKKSDLFSLKSLHRGGEVLYVKNKLYNGNYRLKKYGTVELNLKNRGELSNEDRKINDEFKNFENGGAYFWTQDSKVSPYGLRTAMAGDQRHKQFFNILKNLEKKNNITQSVKILYNYHDRLKPTDIYRIYDPEGVKYWVRQVNKGNLSYNAMVTYVMLATDEPLQNLTQFWGSGKTAKRKAETELSFVKALSRGITQLSDISRFSNPAKYTSSASIRGDLRNSGEYNKLLQDVYKREGESSAIALLYVSVLGRPVDPDGQPFYVNQFNKYRSEGLNPMDALSEIERELSQSAEYQDALKRPIN